MFRIVLVHPEIPQNAGGIGRLCVDSGNELVLIRPLGFSLDDKYVKRAGMDYWPKVKLKVFDTWEYFLADHGERALYFFSTKTKRSFWDCSYEKDAALVFGSESTGLPKDFYTRYEENLYTIPQPGEFHRSLNLANSVAVALYEGMRRFR